MKKKFSIILIMSIAILALTACTIKKPPKNLQIQGSGTFDEKTFTFQVTSSLPKNAKLDFMIKDQDSKKSVYETTLVTDEKGSVDKRIAFVVGKQNLESLILFKPEKQTKDIQSIYGKYGQNIRNNAFGYQTGKKDHENYSFIKLYGTFIKYGSLLKGGDVIFDKKPLKIEVGG
ncbi:hypothetical protein V7056_04565 [Bacillus sp. JJ664]